MKDRNQKRHRAVCAVPQRPEEEDLRRRRQPPHAAGGSRRRGRRRDPEGAGPHPGRAAHRLERLRVRPAGVQPRDRVLQGAARSRKGATSCAPSSACPRPTFRRPIRSCRSTSWRDRLSLADSLRHFAGSLEDRLVDLDDAALDLRHRALVFLVKAATCDVYWLCTTRRRTRASHVGRLASDGLSWNCAVFGVSGAARRPVTRSIRMRNTIGVRWSCVASGIEAGSHHMGRL